MRVFSFALISFYLMHGSAIAKCLPDPNFSGDCRYPKGDAWCAEHETNSPYAYSDQCLEKRSWNVAKAVIPQRFHGHWEQSADACESGSDTYFYIGENRLSTAADQCEIKKILNSNNVYFIGVFYCNMENIVEYEEQNKFEIKNNTLVVNDEHVFFYCK